MPVSAFIGALRACRAIHSLFAIRHSLNPPEQAEKILSDHRGSLLQLKAALAAEKAVDVGDHGRFASSAAMRDRRKIGTIRLEDHAVERNFAGNGPHFLGVPEREDAGEGEIGAEIERPARELGAAGIAMHENDKIPFSAFLLEEIAHE